MAREDEEDEEESADRMRAVARAALGRLGMTSDEAAELLWEPLPGPLHRLTYRDRNAYKHITIPEWLLEEFGELCNRAGLSQSDAARLLVVLGMAVASVILADEALERSTRRKLERLRRGYPGHYYARWTAELDQFEDSMRTWALCDDLLGQVEETLHLVRTIDSISNPRERRVAVSLFLLRAEDERKLKGWIDSLPDLAAVTDRGMVEEIMGIVGRWRAEKRTTRWA